MLGVEMTTTSQSPLSNSSLCPENTSAIQTTRQTPWISSAKEDADRRHKQPRPLRFEDDKDSTNALSPSFRHR
ncbi:hypothetical protein HanXRQr2_Chr13g0606741 [Helianthus annuus]|uniref:Uncharacterized protein n=1 Tax=Helianthus annuus TaxID=4232 RepID=A0A9K3EKK9_HELAN|nr:hypothetical protein HanXRQr2_Chr13g0606741 [Helianthus annuus]KAJ0850795.1 hypothetical protein HanPSC8_Chr13g0584981 [Helianthus annuus]